MRSSPSAVGPEDPLHPVKDAWRAFELGPRKLPGAGKLPCQRFRVAVGLDVPRVRYPGRLRRMEWDLKHPKKGPKTVKAMDGMYRGERIGAHPADGFRCKVQLRNR